MSEEQIKYQKHYIPLTRDELVERLHLALRPKRFNHVLRVEKTELNWQRLMVLIQKRQVLLDSVMIMQSNAPMMFLSK